METSSTYQVLKTAWTTNHLVKAAYKNKQRLFSVRQLGWKGQEERCLAWQHSGESDGELPGYRCLVVSLLENVELGGPIPPEEEPTGWTPPPCVTVKDRKDS